MLQWFATQPTQGLFVSAVTLAEMLIGVRMLPAGKRHSRLDAAVRAVFDEDFAGRVLPFDGPATSDCGPVDLAVRRPDRRDRAHAWA